MIIKMNVQVPNEEDLAEFISDISEGGPELGLKGHMIEATLVYDFEVFDLDTMRRLAESNGVAFDVSVMEVIDTGPDGPL
jgi:hypothetical protein